MATYTYIEIGDQRTASHVDKCETRSRDISIPEFTGTFSCICRPMTLTPLLNVITTKFCGGMRSSRQNFSRVQILVREVIFLLGASKE